MTITSLKELIYQEKIVELLKNYSGTTESGLEMPEGMSKGEQREFKGKLKKLGLSQKNDSIGRVVGGPSPAVGVKSGVRGYVY